MTGTHRFFQTCGDRQPSRRSDIWHDVLAKAVAGVQVHRSFHLQEEQTFVLSRLVQHRDRKVDCDAWSLAGTEGLLRRFVPRWDRILDCGALSCARIEVLIAGTNLAKRPRTDV